MINKDGTVVVGKKGRSGDKPDSVKFAAFINSGLANEIGNQELRRIKNTPSKKRKREDLKEIVMPVVLKSITEKSDVNVKGITITFDPIFNATARLPKKD